MAWAFAQIVPADIRVPRVIHRGGMFSESMAMASCRLGSPAR